MGLVKQTAEVEGAFGSTGLANVEAMKIHLKEGALPYAVNTAHRVPFPILTQVEEELKRLEQAGVIEKVTDPNE